MSRFARIDHPQRRLADEVHQRILDAIADGTIRSGEQLVQDALADEMTVSRTPVREALLRLEREGILEPGPKRGFLVVEYTVERVRDVYQARQAVEGFASRLVADQASDEAVATLDPILTAHIATADLERAFNEDRLAHRAVVATSGNTALVQLFDSLWEKVTLLRNRADSWASLSDHDHAELFDAIAAGDPDRAEASMVAHIGRSLDKQIAAMRRS